MEEFSLRTLKVLLRCLPALSVAIEKSDAILIHITCFVLIYLFNLFIFWLRWVFIAVRGLFSSCGERGLLFVVVRGLLIAVASLVVEHGL